MLKNEKKQLTTFVVQVEQENASRERQLQSEQSRIKELQLNIQMLDEHYSKVCIVKCLTEIKIFVFGLCRFFETRLFQ